MFFFARQASHSKDQGNWQGKPRTPMVKGFRKASLALLGSRGLARQALHSKASLTFLTFLLRHYGLDDGAGQAGFLVIQHAPA